MFNKQENFTSLKEIADLNGLLILKGNTNSGKSLLLHEIIQHDLKQDKKCYLIQEKWHKEYSREYDDLKNAGLIIYDSVVIDKEKLIELLNKGNVYFDDANEYILQLGSDEFDNRIIVQNKLVMTGQRLLEPDDAFKAFYMIKSEEKHIIDYGIKLQCRELFF